MAPALCLTLSTSYLPDDHRGQYSRSRCNFNAPIIHLCRFALPRAAKGTGLEEGRPTTCISVQGHNILWKSRMPVGAYEAILPVSVRKDPSLEHALPRRPLLAKIG